MGKLASCIRCCKREGFGKHHEKICFNNHVFHMCVECSQIAYKMKDAVVENNTALANELMVEFKQLPKVQSEILLQWLDEYKKRIGLSQ